MLTRDDIIDIIMERLLTAPPLPAAKRRRLDGEIRGRKFLSEYDIRKQLTVNSQELKIPEDSIISPLATDWLTLRRIKIVRE
jgi:hypothetical protein